MPVGDGLSPIRTLKARSIIVDTEEGVINEMLKGPLGEVLDTTQMISDVSGAGNNWAHGHNVYGPQYHEQLLEKIQRCVEECDSLQSFLLLHSLGGGTGSGVGTYILQLLADEYPDVFRFTCSVFPSEDDDVVTSPYNAMLALTKLVEHADCVLPIENQALMDICDRLEVRLKSSPSKPSSATSAMGGVELTNAAGGSGKAKPFDAMNGIAATMLLNMTSSVRFEGSLNVDLNDITMNLVPYPRMHFLITSMSPLLAARDVAKLAVPRTVDQAFSEVFTREQQLIHADPRRSTYLACGLLMRGPATIADINRNIQRLKPHLKMVRWNTEGFKIGICARPPVGVPYALLCLSNNTAITDTFTNMKTRFDKLYKRRLFLHHYEQYTEKATFEHAVEVVSDIMSKYQEIDTSRDQPLTRVQPRGLSFL